MIISGNYNGEQFTYKSERDTTLTYPFNPAIEVPEFNQVFGFLITNDTSRWFFGPNGLLDPNDPQNSKEINDNIFQSFQIDLPE